MDVPDPVRRLAVYPFHELPRPRDVEIVELDGAFIGVNPWPTAQMVGIRGRGPADVAATVKAARAVAKARGKTVIAWWIPPDHDHVAPTLESAGLVNEATPGFEAIENAMALVDTPRGDVVEDVEVRVTESWDDYREGSRVVETVFGMPHLTDDELRRRYDEYRHPDNPGRAFAAWIDGRIVGTAFGAFGEAGVNLFGGAVLPAARGRGVYRALIQARWQAACARRTPALTVQAGRMSRPICERLGFTFVAPVRVFVDKL